MSVFALAACAGGGGGGSGTTPRAAIVPGSAVATEVAESNAYITSMAPEILVASNGRASSPVLGRSATATYNGQRYTSYRLDDVNFKIGGEDAVIKFGLDENGKIISAGRYGSNGSGVYNVLSPEGTFNRNGDDSAAFGGTKTLYVWRMVISSTGLADYLEAQGNLGGVNKNDAANVIAQHFSSIDIESDDGSLSDDQVKAAVVSEISKKLNKVKNSQPNNNLDLAFADALTFYTGKVAEASVGARNAVTAKLDIIASNADLKYADFGVAYLRKSTDGDAFISESIYAPYVGGYEQLKINPANLSGETSFTGKVMAGLERSQKVDGDKLPKEGVLVSQNNAGLVMRQDGSSTLTMNNLEDSGGNNWYTLVIDKAANGVPTFTFGGSNEIGGYDLPNETEIMVAASGVVDFSGEGAGWSDNENAYVKNVGIAGTGRRQEGFIETTAYGMNNTDEHMEATARFNFSDQYYHNNNQDQESVAIYGAFGGGVTP